jgi:WS/DGAT/MGAT family acyltransferase
MDEEPMDEPTTASSAEVVVAQLSALDAAFLELESDSGHLHGVGVIHLVPGAPRLTLEELTALVGGRLDRLDVFRRRLLTVPGGLDRPYWVDSTPELASHLHEVDVSDRDGGFEGFCSELASSRLDRSRHLWELWLVHGSGPERQSLVVKIHHSLCDGIGSLALVAQLLDTDPDGIDDAGSTADGIAEGELPGPFGLLTRSAANVARRSVGIVGATADLATSVVRLVRVVTSTDEDVAAPLATPVLPYQGALSARRSTALRELPLDRVKAVAHAAGAHVNDVVLAVVTGTLRRWLIASDAVPDRAAVAAVPVSTRSPEQLFEPGNHVSAYFAHLPVHLERARDRLDLVVSSSNSGKAVHRAVGPATLEHLTGLLLPVLTVLPVAAYRRFRLADRHPAPVNLVVSDVPGPSIPLYLAGRQAEAFYALGPVFDGVGLNITAVSYNGVIGVGYVTCPDLLEDIGALADHQVAAFEELAEAYGV